jgi:transcriptional regulator with XRE-family HTH domain
MKTKEQLKRDTSDVLRGLRNKKSQEEDIRLTQADVAYGAGVSVRYYNDIENGKKLPTLDTLMRIAYSYKMTLGDICKQIEEY